MEFTYGQLIIGTPKANKHPITKEGCVGRFIRYKGMGKYILEACWVYNDTPYTLNHATMDAYADCFIPAVQKVS